MNTRNMVVFLLVSILCGCSGEFVTSQESDLSKYPEIHIFAHEMARFHGDVTDLERGTFRFSYTSRESEPESLLQAIDQKAAANGWLVILRQGLKRGYSKNLHRYPAQSRSDVVLIEYDPGMKKVRVEWQSG